MNAILALILRGLLLLLAYLFVGWIGYTIFKDLKSLFLGRENLQRSPIILKVMDGQEPIEKQFTKHEIILGRDPDCDLTISDETVSLKHCKLTHHHKQWWANDLKSTNGSFLNDNLIESDVIITNGDVMQLGNVSIFIQISQK